MNKLVLIAMVVACGKPSDNKQPIVAAKAKDFKACDLTSAAEVGKIFNKPMIVNDSGAFCAFSLDPAEVQKSLEAMTSGKAKTLDQVQIMVSVARDDETEDQIKTANANVSGAVMTAMVPEGTARPVVKHVISEVPNIGEWAFTTDMSLTMNGIAVGGRTLDARVGAWRVTITATVSPDPGAEKLDAELMGLAHPIVAKLKS